jgi:hypothetical protein
MCHKTFSVTHAHTAEFIGEKLLQVGLKFANKVNILPLDVYTRGGFSLTGKY